MDERYIERVSNYLQRDFGLLEQVQRDKGVLLKNGQLSVATIRKCTSQSLQPFIDLLLNKRIPIENVFDSIHRYYDKKDERMIFNLIFFYCAFYYVDLPDLLLPLAINKYAMRIYFNEWLKKIDSLLGNPLF